MQLLHFAASVCWPHRPFMDRSACVEVWMLLQRRFPRVLACVLMPDHFHLVVEYASVESLAKAMSTEMSTVTRRLMPRGSRLWQRASLPVLIPNLQHLRRQIRYVHLNPCRGGLAPDPLAWEWSTHRDAVGAAFPDWLDRRMLDRAFGYPGHEFAKKFHAYVSSDPDVRIEGTPLPESPHVGEMVATFTSIEWAVLQATRANEESRSQATPARRLMMLAAERLGIPRRLELAQWLGIRPRTIREALSTSVSAHEETALQSVMLLLSARGRFESRPLAQTLGAAVFRR